MEYIGRLESVPKGERDCEDKFVKQANSTILQVGDSFYKVCAHMFHIIYSTWYLSLVNDTMISEKFYMHAKI